MKVKSIGKAGKYLGLPKFDGRMGCRNLGEFNTALLAKQVWRLHTKPNPFWARIIKGIYYPHTSVLQAGKGSRASWAWSSLLEGKALIDEGARWLVGNGNSIDIWRDKWILNSDVGYIRPVLPIPHSAPTKVSNLIDWEVYTMNLQQITELISAPNKAAIEMQLFSDTQVDDRLILPITKNDSYTVKSGYNLFHSLNFKPSVHLNHSSHRVHPSVWKAIWSIWTLPKINHFLWQCANNAMSTYQNLFQRKIIRSSMCPICQQTSETIEHILLRCPNIVCTWFSCSLNYKINTQQNIYQQMV